MPIVKCMHHEYLICNCQADLYTASWLSDQIKKMAMVQDKFRYTPTINKISTIDFLYNMDMYLKNGHNRQQ